MSNRLIFINKQLVGLFILLGIFSCDGKELFLMTTPSQQQDAFLSLPDNSLLDKQIQQVKSYINSQTDSKSNNTPAYLVLGVNNQEEDLLKRFDDSYIFLNIAHGNPDDLRILTVDFNDLTQLSYLANHLADTFDKIILDDSTFKFTTWTQEHLKKFHALLKPKGEFIFAPQFDALPSDENAKLEKEEAEQLLKAQAPTAPIEWQAAIQQAALSYVIQKSKLQPFRGQLEGNQLIARLGDFIALPMDIYFNIFMRYHSPKPQASGQVPGLKSPTALTEQEEIEQEEVALIAASLAVLNTILVQVIVPQNSERLLQQVFGSENVQIAYNKPLPFYSRFNKDNMVVLITSRKK